MLVVNNFQPTYLYIKQHSVTKKCYFGKTAKLDPIKYLGSGTRWLRHIKLHRKEFVETLWYCLFLDQEELTKFALMFSEQQDVVKSEDWLNMKIEDGLDGRDPASMVGNKYALGSKGPLGFKHTPETCAIQSAISTGNKNALGFKHTTETCIKVSIGLMGNKNSLGYEHPKVICPYCKLEGASNLMKRYHFDNCKKKAVI